MDNLNENDPAAVARDVNQRMENNNNRRPGEAEADVQNRIDAPPPQRVQRNRAELVDNINQQVGLIVADFDLEIEPVGGRFVVDEAMVGVVLHAFLALYGMQNGKVAHLRNGDPFKERVNVYCYFIASYYVRLLQFMVPNIRPVAVRNNAPHQRRRPNVVRRAGTQVMTLVRGVVARTQGGRQQPRVNAPRLRNQLPILRVRFPLLDRLNRAFNVMTLTGVRQDLIEGANRQKREFMRHVLNDFNEIENEERRCIAQLQFIFGALERIADETGERASAYYVDALGCGLQVADRIREAFEGPEGHENNHLNFDFTPLVTLVMQMVGAYETFAFVMRDAPVYRIDNSNDGREYSRRTAAFLGLGHLDPLGNDHLVQGAPVPTHQQLIIRGGELLAEEVAAAAAEAAAAQQ